MPARILTAIAIASLGAAAQGQLQVGQKFPDFSGRGPDGLEVVRLADHRGKLVLVDFWATWCGPCLREIPLLKHVYGRYRDRGFEIISISLDDKPQLVQAVVQQQGMNWKHVAEGGGWNTRLAREFKIKSIPQMFLLDPDGRIVAAGLRGETLPRTIEEAMRRTPPRVTQRQPTDAPLAYEEQVRRAGEGLAIATVAAEDKRYLEALHILNEIQRCCPDAPQTEQARELTAELFSLPEVQKLREEALQRQEERRQRDARDREARTLVAMARGHIERQQHARARELLEQVIREYPQTRPADVAGNLLKSLPQPKP